MQIADNYNIIIFLIALIALLITAGFIEYYNHLQSLKKLPIRIHVNGARGKSSVTRLIAAGLRAGGLNTIAKVTGSAPRIINEQGKDLVIHRLRSASIGEQVKLLRNFAKKKLDAVVIECMAVQPQYQWVAEHKMIQSTIGVITNVRPDHIDEMGSTMDDIAYSLSNTIPFNGSMITSESENVGPIRTVSEERNTKLNIVDSSDISDSYMMRFPYLEHAENVAIALQVCKDAGVKSDVALEGMLKASPDPGALVIWELQMKKKHHFVSAFAANDPKSTLQIWKLLYNRIQNNKICIFLNTRSDRMYRTKQLLQLVIRDINPDMLIVRGDNLPDMLSNVSFNSKIFPLDSSSDEIIQYINQLDSCFIMGIGNIVGWGESFVSKIKEYKI